MGKVFLCVIGQFLCHIGIWYVLVRNKIYGPFVRDNKIMTGSNYILSQQAFRMLHEAVSPLQFAKFE